MFLASSLDPDIVQFGRAVGFILFLGVLPCALIVLVVTGIKLISRRTTKRIVIFIISGLVSAALLLPLVLVFRGVLTSRSFGTVKPRQTTIVPQSPIQPKVTENVETVAEDPQRGSWTEFTGITTTKESRIVSAADIYKRFSPAVVTIVTEPSSPATAKNQSSMQGTGVIFRAPSTTGKSGYWLLTCYHIMSGMKGQFNLLNSKDQAISVTAEAALVDAENDWCLVPLMFSSKREFDDLPVFHMIDALPEVGEDMFAIGTPEGMDLTLSKGIVSSIRNVDQGDWIQTTCPVSSGSSGSPAFDSNGSFLGIAVESLKEGQNINFLVSAQTMRDRFNSDKLVVIPFDSPAEAGAPYRISPDTWRFVEDDSFLKKKRFQRIELNGRKFPQQLHLYSEPMDTSNDYYKDYSKLFPGVMVKTEQNSPGYVTLTMDMFAGNEHLVSIETWPLPQNRTVWPEWIMEKFEATLVDLNYDSTSTK